MSAAKLTVPSDELEQYVRDLVGTEDAALLAARDRHEAADLPTMQISAEQGRLLAVLLRAIRARRVLEIGTLGGYSGIWIARSLVGKGHLDTIEANPDHAAVARGAFGDAGLDDRITIFEGDAVKILPTLHEVYDAVFLDADKEPLPTYFREAVRLTRVGGWVLCDNTFYHGRVLDPDDRADDVEGIRAYNRLASEDPRLVTAIVPVRDGLMISLKVGD